jgi:hypothetical protein
MPGISARGLAADTGAAGLPAAVGDAANNRARGFALQTSGGEIVQKTQRLGALHDKVVDTHCDQVDSDGPMQSRGKRDHQLGADAVGRRHQHRIAIARGGGIEETAESAERCIGARTHCTAGQWLDHLHQCFAGIDVDSRCAIIQAFRGRFGCYGILAAELV